MNDIPIAIVDYKTGSIDFQKKNYEKRDENRKLVVKDKFEEKVGLLKTHINMQPEIFEFFEKNKYSFIIENKLKYADLLKAKKQLFILFERNLTFQQ